MPTSRSSPLWRATGSSQLTLQFNRSQCVSSTMSLSALTAPSVRVMATGVVLLLSHPNLTFPMCFKHSLLVKFLLNDTCVCASLAYCLALSCLWWFCFDFVFVLFVWVFCGFFLRPFRHTPVFFYDITVNKMCWGRRYFLPSFSAGHTCIHRLPKYSFHHSFFRRSFLLLIE